MARLPESFRELLAETAVEMQSPDSGGRPPVTGARRAHARLEHLYGYAIRHTAHDRAHVIREVARQTLRHGPAYVVGRCSREAELFVSWGQQVYREVYRAQRQIQFQRGRRERELSAHWRFQFPVVDLVLRHFHRRLREHTLVLVDGDRAYVHDGCGIRLERAGPRRGAPGRRAPTFMATALGGGQRALTYPQ